MATSPTPAGGRIASLDIVRGVAVMGILAMNVLAFALPAAAYSNPIVYGNEGPADIASWALSFVFVDGKMRGLFSFLFGASTLLVIERAEAAGMSGAEVHYRRMAWLLVFGLIHFYLIWWGDILSLYAPVGMIAYAFRDRSPRALIGTAAGLLLLQLLLLTALAVAQAGVAAGAALPNASAEAVQNAAKMQQGLGPYTPAGLAEQLALYRGDYAGIVRHNLAENLWEPLNSLVIVGAETLAYMLLGMAALKSGFLTGALSKRAYARWALAGFAIGIPAYAVLAWAIMRADFAVPALVAWGFAAPVPLRPPMIAASAALIILATRHGGPLTARIAAAGRAAFTNYLGTSLVMTTIFYGYGLGLFGDFRRVALWPFVFAAWALMLLWSKPWLDRFHYGPFEWLWRSLSRWSPQPMRRSR